MKHIARLGWVAFALFMGSAALAADRDVKYTFLVNEVPDGQDMPLIGLINTAHGNQDCFQIGFINTNERNLVGGQFGFINNVGRDMQGLQLGFLNTTDHDQIGLQAGFINAVDNRFQGIQFGFINAIGEDIQGIQLGFINAVEKVMGFQFGFINATENLNGFQVGFINAAERTHGTQAGFINATGRLNGLQLGFVNWVDRVDDGTPVGFLSFVRQGGLKAFEFSFSESYPYNIAYKTGVDRFYTFPMLSYNPDMPDSWAIGYGVGSIVPMNDEVYFNPEVLAQNTVSSAFEQRISLGLNFGHAFTENMHFVLGPSLVWNRSSVNKPMFTLHQWNIDTDNSLYLGLRAALRYRF